MKPADVDGSHLSVQMPVNGATCFNGIRSFDINEIKNLFGNLLICHGGYLF